MSRNAQIQAYGLEFPVLLTTPSPRGKVELLETIGKGNYGYVYKVRQLPFFDTGLGDSIEWDMSRAGSSWKTAGSRPSKSFTSRRTSSGRRCWRWKSSRPARTGTSRRSWAASSRAWTFGSAWSTAAGGLSTPSIDVLFLSLSLFGVLNSLFELNRY